MRASLLFLLLAGCGNRPNVVRIAIPAGMIESAPVYLCKDLGHLREEGIEATIEPLQGSRTLEALVGGSVDVSYDSGITAFQVIGQGKRVKIFFVAQRTSNLLLVTSPTSAARIRRIPDLTGATVGVVSFGAGQHHLLQFVLAKYGVPSEQVRVVARGAGPRAIAALENGLEDAGMITGGAFNILRRRAPNVRVLLDVRGVTSTEQLFGNQDFINLSLCSTTDWLGRNPDTARRLTRAMKRTLDWIRRRQAGTVLARVPESLRSTDSEADIESIRYLAEGLSEDGRMPEGGPELMRRITGTPLEKLRTQGIELSQTYTNEFVPEK